MASIQITQPQAEKARETFRGDWDDNGVTTVYLPNDRAEALQEKLGIEKRTDGRYYVGPDNWFWERDEAIQHALVAWTFEA